MLRTPEQSVLTFLISLLQSTTVLLLKYSRERSFSTRERQRDARRNALETIGKIVRTGRDAYYGGHFFRLQRVLTLHSTVPYYALEST